MDEKINQKIMLLSKSVWSVTDIMDYTLKSRPTAFRLKKRAITEFDGGVPYSYNYVKVDSVLAILGTSKAKELESLSHYEKKD